MQFWKNPTFRYLTALLFVFGSFWGGIEARDAVARAREARSAQTLALSGVLGCVYAADSLSMHFLYREDVGTLLIAHRMLDGCESLLDQLGASVQDEETSAILGEAKLFYDGYRTTMSEILSRQVQLGTLYNAIGGMADLRKAEALEEQQQRQVHESQEFVNRLNALLLQAW